jgi:hypothetical protein
MISGVEIDIGRWKNGFGLDKKLVLRNEKGRSAPPILSSFLLGV